MTLEEQIKAQADVLAPGDILVTALEKAGFVIGKGKPPTKDELIKALSDVGITVSIPDIVDAERLALMPEETQTCVCDNCGWSGPDADTGEIKDVMMRVAPGEIMPVGECPDCGALVHLPSVTPET